MSGTKGFHLTLYLLAISDYVVSVCHLLYSRCIAGVDCGADAWFISRIKNGLLSIVALMLDYNDIVVMCLQLITLRIVS